MNVIVTDYNDAWPMLFNTEAGILRKIFGGELVDIHHFGSTAVPGLMAKPVIDIMPVVKHIDAVDALSPRMLALGYEQLGEFGIPGRRYFRKGGDNRTHHVHVFQYDNEYEIQRHLAVRDYLRAHSEVAAEYGALKVQLAQAYPSDIDAYCDGKDAFVKELERRAVLWRRSSQP